MADNAHDSTASPNRRKALKALAAAAGAAGIAALPTQWSKPVAHIGAVPAHAQASICGPHVILPEADGSEENCVVAFNFEVPITIDPPTDGIAMRMTVAVTGTIDGSDPTTVEGDYVTSGGGQVTTSPLLTMALDVYAGLNSIDFTWSFVNPADGCDTYTFTLYCNNILDP